MRKTKEIVSDLIKDEKDPAKLTLAAELSEAQKAEEERIAQLTADNDKLSALARDALINGGVGVPKKGESMTTSADTKPKTFEELIADAMTKKEGK